MKKTITVNFALILVLIGLAFYAITRSKTAQESGLGQLANEDVPVRFLAESSYFHDFQINEELGQVELRCELAFCNQTDAEQSFTVSANFESDQEGRLLRQGLLQGVEGETGQTMFMLEPGENAAYDIRFIGEYGGRPKKAHRELPEEITVYVNGESYIWKTRVH